MDLGTRKRILAVKDRISAKFSSSDWQELGVLTDSYEMIDNHYRLLRSLNFGDTDYEGHVLTVLNDIVEKDPAHIELIEDYVKRKYPLEGEEAEFVSDKPSERKLVFAPHLFEIPKDWKAEGDLVAVMMSFGAAFSGVHKAIKGSCEDNCFRCVRADDIWEHSIIIQDIFSLILRARAVIVDFTGKNPNVMYETGIAHALGKLVIPITQHIDDVPFDIRHHRVLKYLANEQGLAELRNQLAEKLRSIDKSNSV